jgi:hypothetical protein
MSNTMPRRVFRQALSWSAQQVGVVFWVGIQSLVTFSRQVSYAQIKKAEVVGTHSPFIIGVCNLVTVCDCFQAPAP